MIYFHHIMHDHVKGCISFQCKQVDRNKDGQLAKHFGILHVMIMANSIINSFL